MFLCVVFKNHVEFFYFRRRDPELLGLVRVKDSKLRDRDTILARRQLDFVFAICVRNSNAISVNAVECHSYVGNASTEKINSYTLDRARGLERCGLLSKGTNRESRNEEK